MFRPNLTNVLGFTDRPCLALADFYDNKLLDGIRLLSVRLLIFQNLNMFKAR